MEAVGSDQRAGLAVERCEKINENGAFLRGNQHRLGMERTATHNDSVVECNRQLECLHMGTHGALLRAHELSEGVRVKDLDDSLPRRGFIKTAMPHWVHLCETPRYSSTA